MNAPRHTSSGGLRRVWLALGAARGAGETNTMEETQKDKGLLGAGVIHTPIRGPAPNDGLSLKGTAHETHGCRHDCIALRWIVTELPGEIHRRTSQRTLLFE